MAALPFESEEMGGAGCVGLGATPAGGLGGFQKGGQMDRNG